MQMNELINPNYKTFKTGNSGKFSHKTQIFFSKSSYKNIGYFKVLKFL